MTYDNFLRLNDTNYHILTAEKNKSGAYFSELEKNLPHTTYLGIVDGKKIHDKKSLFDEFCVAFKFPDYFGYNWDAFDECINDLEWLNSKSYILVISNFEQVKLDQPSYKIWLDVMRKAIKEWTNGRNYNPEFATPPTPFHIIFVIKEDSCLDTIESLRINGINKVDII
jgi:RNAse (barnase) inhibitor barstar